MSLLLLFLAGFVFLSTESRSISPSEREAIWNNFKYRNAFIRWTIMGPNSTGSIIQGDDPYYSDPVFLVNITRHNMLIIILPLSENTTQLYSAQIPAAEYPFEMILTVGQDLLVATSKCQKVLHDRLADVNFKINTPEITLGSLPYFYQDIQISSGNPLPSFCSVLLHQEVPTNKERMENKRRVVPPHTDEKDTNVTCRRNEVDYLVGERVNITDCQPCICTSSGDFECDFIGCLPMENCSFPLHNPGSCCPTRCGNECEFNGLFHHHGSVFWPETCVRCECNDGFVHCKFNHEHMCPALPCPKAQQRKQDGQCCPSCVNFDYCSVNPCHADASCTSSELGAKCRCKEGFFGNGTFCYDIDECSFTWSIQEQLGGCSGSTCVNTKGSFRCDCLPGHPRIDERTCLSLIRI